MLARGEGEEAGSVSDTPTRRPPDTDADPSEFGRVDLPDATPTAGRFCRHPFGAGPKTVDYRMA